MARNGVQVRSSSYRRSSANTWKHLMRRTVTTIENRLKRYTLLKPQRRLLTLLACIFAVLITIYSLAVSRAVLLNCNAIKELREEEKQKLPLKQSYAGIEPTYSCIREHLRQTELFQEKANEMLRKENLEIEIMKSRIACMKKLLTAKIQRVYIDRSKFVSSVQATPF